MVIGGGCDGSRGIWDSFWISCGVAHSGKGLISVFREFSASIGKNFILAGGLGTRLYSMKFRQFLDISKILSLKSFGNSYIPCL